MSRVFAAGLLISLLAWGCGTQHRSNSTHAASGRRQRELAAIIDSSGRLAAAVTGNGQIETAVADPHGGWYVSGSFTRLDGYGRDGLARLLADGKPDLSWHPERADGTLIAASMSAVYFARLVGSLNFRLTVLDARTGRKLASSIVSGYGEPLAVADGQRLYISNVLPPPKTCAVGLDRLGRRILYRFQVHMLPEVSCLNQLAIRGRWLYAVGALGVKYPGMRPPRMSVSFARFDLANGRLDQTWVAKPLPPCAGCYGDGGSIAFASGRVFVSAGVGRHSVAALSPNTGDLVHGWGAPGTLVKEGGWLAVAGKRLFIARATGRPDLGVEFITLDIRDGALLPSWHPSHGLVANGTLIASKGRVLIGLEPAH